MEISFLKEFTVQIIFLQSVLSSIFEKRFKTCQTHFHRSKNPNPFKCFATVRSIERDVYGTFEITLLYEIITSQNNSKII